MKLSKREMLAALVATIERDYPLSNGDEQQKYDRVCERETALSELMAFSGMGFPPSHTARRILRRTLDQIRGQEAAR